MSGLLHQLIEKGKVMKLLSLALLLMASMAFVLSGCGENADPLVSPTDQSLSMQRTGAPLAKVGPVVQRPLSDFLSTQVSQTLWYNGDNPLYRYHVDFAGVISRAYGLSLTPTFEGTITERPLADGRAEVIVDIRSHNALTWMNKWYANYDVVFGEHPFAIKAGAPPTLGYVHLLWNFINEAPGAPIPDFQADVPTKSVKMEARAFGPIKAASGLGPDGTPGHGWTTQVGVLQKFLYDLPLEGQPGTDQGYTAQFVKLEAITN
jgi:hypothetical protein